MRHVIPSDLVTNVELLCLDAGNTIVFLDHAALARTASAHGFALDAAAVERAEGDTKRRLEHGSARLAPPLADSHIPPSWSAFVRTLVETAGGLDRDASAQCVRALWAEHHAFNLWRRVPEGFEDALERLAGHAVKICVVSNSEGHLDALFERLGLTHLFDRVVDSHLVGFEKPDVRIFRDALASFGVSPDRALHLGDTYATDIVGARDARIRCAMIDPFGHYEGQHPDVVRVPGVVAVVDAILDARARDAGAAM